MSFKKKKCMYVWDLKGNTRTSLRTKAPKFKVYVLHARTQAYGLAGIITTHSSVTVTLLSLTSARVTHILYTHIQFAFLLLHRSLTRKHHQSHSSKLKIQIHTCIAFTSIREHSYI